MTLRLLCWDHERCVRPMEAAAAAWQEAEGVAVEISARPLAAFNDQPVTGLIGEFDLVFVDHPFVGTAARSGCLAPLDALLGAEQMAALAADAIGPSHASYAYAGHQWALAADAACQVSAARDDLLAALGVAAPRTWDGVLELARARPGSVALPLYPSDAACSLLTLCATLGRPIGAAGFDPAAVAVLSELAALVDDECFELNPPQLLARMREQERWAFVPLTFGYAPLAGPAGTPGALRFADAPTAAGGARAAILGGAGIAVSAERPQRAEAARFAAWACGAEAQLRLVGAHGGQPASRAAWHDAALDRAAHGFFSGTRASIEQAWVRPREPWWPEFQREAGERLAAALRARRPAPEIARELDALLDRARTPARIASTTPQEGTPVPTLLDGIRVLDFSQMMLGPYATQLLGDMGADVIKVERPGSGEWERGLEMMGELVAGDSAAFLAMNRNKRSVAVDLKHGPSRDALLELGRTCDVVVENFRPGVLARLGLGYEDFRRVRPDIIFCSGSGWGQDTRFARENRPGQDLLIQAMSGLAANAGRAGEPPVVAGSSVVDAMTGLTLAVGVLGALLHRERTGIGQQVAVDLFSTAMSIQCQEISAMVNQGTEYARSPAGVAQPWLSAPFGIYATADGWLAIAMAPLDVIGELMGDPSLGELDAWLERDAAKERLDALTPQRSTDAWLDVLQRAGIWAARVRSTKEAVDELREEGSELIQTVEHPRAGKLELIGCPVGFSATPWSLRLPPPLVGEHTEEVLGEVLDAERLAEVLDAAGARA
jgi:crotonobetainyl-CoA:carnitine CoA-transferase CaiB-like acyl-CoA transferase/ABC-type glycerol-3-phosphate transport system substrate-binding protein